MIKPSILTLGIAAFLVGCDDDATGPGSNSVDGDWAYSAVGLIGGGLSCDVRDVVLTMSQNAGSITGSTTGGTIVCSVGGAQSVPQPLDTGTVTGTIDSASILFEIMQGANVVQHVATLAGNQLTGSANAMIDFGEPAGVVVSTGSFSAVRE